MISRVNFSAVNYTHKKPSFTGEKEIQAIVDEASDIGFEKDPDTTDKLGLLAEHLNRLYREHPDTAPSDIREASKRVTHPYMKKDLEEFADIYESH